MGGGGVHDSILTMLDIPCQGDIRITIEKPPGGSGRGSSSARVWYTTKPDRESPDRAACIMNWSAQVVNRALSPKWPAADRTAAAGLVLLRHSRVSLSTVLRPP